MNGTQSNLLKIKSEIKRYIPLLLLIGIWACNTSDDAAPSQPNSPLSQRVEGRYDLTAISYFGGRYQLPEPGISGELTLERINDTTVRQIYFIKVKEKHPMYNLDTFSGTDTLTLRLVDNGKNVLLGYEKDVSSIGIYFNDTRLYKPDIQYQNLPLVLKTEFKKR